MRIQISHAGLADDVVQRLHAAARTLAVHDIQANVEAWNGTRCDVVVLDPSDAYALYVLDIARKRDMTVIAFGDVAPAFPRLRVVAPRVEVIAHALADSFAASGALPVSSRPQPRAILPTASDTEEGAQLALVRLATEPRLRHVDVEATRSTHRILLLRSRGRVLARHDGMLSDARTTFSESGWNLVPLDADAKRHIEDAHSVSLDSFLLRNAWSVRRALPPFPADARVRLTAWPDLGTATTIVEALQIVDSALSTRSTAAEISARSGASARDTSACLWAFQAAGLIEHDGTAPALIDKHADRQPRSGLFARIASHFGLSRP